MFLNAPPEGKSRSSAMWSTQASRGPRAARAAASRRHHPSICCGGRVPASEQRSASVLRVEAERAGDAVHRQRLVRVLEAVGHDGAHAVGRQGAISPHVLIAAPRGGLDEHPAHGEGNAPVLLEQEGVHAGARHAQQVVGVHAHARRHADGGHRGKVAGDVFQHCLVSSPDGTSGSQMTIWTFPCSRTFRRRQGGGADDRRSRRRTR